MKSDIPNIRKIETKRKTSSGNYPMGKQEDELDDATTTTFGLGETRAVKARLQCFVISMAFAQSPSEEVIGMLYRKVLVT